MSDTILALFGWGLFYGGLLLHVAGTIAERAFFTENDPEHWDPKSRRSIDFRDAMNAYGWDRDQAAPLLTRMRAFGS
jgi:hypothetical protein